MTRLVLISWLAVLPISTASILSGGLQTSKASGTAVDLRGIWVGKKLDAKKARARALDPTTMETPVKIVDATPSYPPEAVANREQGVVRLECRIDTDGIVRDCKVTKKVSKLLNASALSCVAQWRYQPLKLAGESRAALVDLEVRFILR
jgi:TonB family protein